MNRNKFLIPIIGLMVLFALVFGGIWARDNAPKPPTPTPTAIPTMAPTATPAPTSLPGEFTVTGLGAPALKDPEIQRILAEPWTDPKTGEYFPPIHVDTRFADTGTDPMLAWGADPVKKKAADYTGIDFVQLGDGFYLTQFKTNNPTVVIKESKALFQTRLMYYTWWRFLPAFQKGGYAQAITETVDGKQITHYVMPSEKFCSLLKMEYDQYTTGKGSWADAGIVFDDPRFTDLAIDLDSSSFITSTGAQLMGTMANCFANNMRGPADISQINDELMGKIEAYVRQQGGQGKASIASFGSFWTDGEGSPGFIAYDSAFLTTALSPDYGLDLATAICVSSDPKNSQGQCKLKNRPVGIYIGNATSAKHTMLALTDHGKQLLHRMSDPRIQKLALTHLGMGTPAVILYDAPISWMSTSEQVGDNPRDEVYAKILEKLRADFK